MWQQKTNPTCVYNEKSFQGYEQEWGYENYSDLCDV